MRFRELERNRGIDISAKRRLHGWDESVIEEERVKRRPEKEPTKPAARVGYGHFSLGELKGVVESISNGKTRGVLISPNQSVTKNLYVVELNWWTR